MKLILALFIGLVLHVQAQQTQFSLVSTEASDFSVLSPEGNLYDVGVFKIRFSAIALEGDLLINKSVLFGPNNQIGSGVVWVPSIDASIDVINWSGVLLGISGFGETANFFSITEGNQAIFELRVQLDTFEGGFGGIKLDSVGLQGQDGNGINFVTTQYLHGYETGLVELTGRGIPEPSSLTLLFSGLILGTVRRRN